MVDRCESYISENSLYQDTLTVPFCRVDQNRKRSGTGRIRDSLRPVKIMSMASCGRGRSLLSTWPVVLLLLLFAASCKKGDTGNQDLEEKDQAVLLKHDSLFLYAQQVYLWNDQLPTYDLFMPRSYFGSSGNEIMGLRNELYAISGYSADPVTKQKLEYSVDHPAVPKFSTIIDPLSISTAEQVPVGYGITFVPFAEGDIRIRYTVPGSPAAKSGLLRGMKILRVNGREAKTSADFYNYLDSALKGAKMELTVGGQADINPQNFVLVPNAYRALPVAGYTILLLGGKKIGYLSYLSFTSPNGLNLDLDRVFGGFDREDITDLIIDLRYNPGGLITACDHLANLIIPSSYDKRVLRKEKYNATMQEGRGRILEKQILTDSYGYPVIINGRPATLADGDYSLEANTYLIDKKSGPKNIRKVYFIVSNRSASAAELLINSLKPYLEVKLIGVSDDGRQQVSTFGKPVGFFGIKIDKYDVYLSMFQNLNADGQGDYFDGMLSNVCVRDDARYGFGDPEDPALKTILDMGLARPRLSSKIAGGAEATLPFLNQSEITDCIPAISGMKKNGEDVKLKKLRP